MEKLNEVNKVNIKFMKAALKEAKKAYDKNEVPVGCVIVFNNTIIARAHNLRETLNQAGAHAEMLAIKKACTKLKSWRLNGCDIYVTVEPCPMCAGAIINARIHNIYFGVANVNGGCCGTLYDIPSDIRFNHNCDIFSDIMEKECSELMTDYFKAQREQKPENHKNSI